MGGGGKLTETGKKSTRQITLDECSAHRTPNDAWLHMRGKVYDVSGWDDHPGTCSAPVSVFIVYDAALFPLQTELSAITEAAIE